MLYDEDAAMTDDSEDDEDYVPVPPLTAPPKRKSSFD
jgi:hypothetical protein